MNAVQSLSLISGSAGSVSQFGIRSPGPPFLPLFFFSFLLLRISNDLRLVKPVNRAQNSVLTDIIFFGVSVRSTYSLQIHVTVGKCLSGVCPAVISVRWQAQYHWFTGNLLWSLQAAQLVEIRI